MVDSYEHPLGFQRARIIEGMVLVVRERGYAGASVSSVCERARVSRRTFYVVFCDLQDCFLAFLDDATEHAATLISEAFDREYTWVGALRGALASLLSFFDSEPAYTHVLLVEATAAGAWARERRERHILTLTTLVERRAGEPVWGHLSPHVTAGVMASLLGVLHTQLVIGRKEPLTMLLGPLMGLVTAPYLDQRRVAQEIQRGEAIARELLACREQRALSGYESVQIPGLLLDPRSHRARACLSYLAEHPGASNRQVADAVGVAGRTQISALLARLHRTELLDKQPSRPGGPNAWSLTQHGLRVLHTIVGDRDRGRPPLAR